MSIFEQKPGAPKAARAFYNLQGEDALLPAEASALKKSGAIALMAMVLLSAPLFWAANAMGLIGDVPTAIAKDGSSGPGGGDDDNSGPGDGGDGDDDDNAGHQDTQGTSAAARDTAGTTAGGDDTAGNNDDNQDTQGTSAGGHDTAGTTAGDGDDTRGR